MGFADNFTRPPTDSPQKRMQHALAPSMMMTPTRANGDSCSNFEGVESRRALAMQDALTRLDLFHSEESEELQSRPVCARNQSSRAILSPSNNRAAQTDASSSADQQLERQFSRSLNFVEHVAKKAEKIIIAAAPSTPVGGGEADAAAEENELFDSPIRRVARDISWGNMEEIFNTPSKVLAPVPKAALSKRSPSKRSIIVNEDPVVATSSEVESKKSTSTSTSPRRDYFTSPVRCIADRLSLRTICTSSARGDQSVGDVSTKHGMRKGSSHDSLARGSQRKTTDYDKAGLNQTFHQQPQRQARKFTLKKTVSVHGGFKPRCTNDDDSTSASTFLDKSCHSIKSVNRPSSRSLYKTSSSSGDHGWKRR